MNGIFPHTIIEGEGPPKFSNGKPYPDCDKLFWRIESSTFEEAMSIYNLRQGWEPYRPQGEVKPCPNCAAMYYPEGSGQCWQCHHQE